MIYRYRDDAQVVTKSMRALIDQPIQKIQYEANALLRAEQTIVLGHRDGLRIDRKTLLDKDGKCMDSRTWTNFGDRIKSRFQGCDGQMEAKYILVHRREIFQWVTPQDEDIMRIQFRCHE